MKTIEIFCGTKSFSKVATKRGYSTITVDNDEKFNPTICMDVLKKGDDGLYYEIFKRFSLKPDILWLSPPCQGFSVAVIGRNWNRDYTPKSDSARVSVALVERSLEIIKELQPKWFFIENPRGMLRKLPYLNHLRRVTVSYCQYGDTRQKPTDIWTNVPEEIWTPKPICKPGADCHEAAPRGSRTGTQGMKNAAERGAIPEALFQEIFNAIQTHD